MGLMEALRTEAFYVGAMGSEKTSASRRLRLQALDLTPAEIARMRAPVGLPIGSKTPPEIAIAILAEITAVLKGAETRVANHLGASRAVAAATVAATDPLGTPATATAG
jgi:xanthine dehydrogenase accessory factor